MTNFGVRIWGGGVEFLSDPERGIEFVLIDSLANIFFL